MHEVIEKALDHPIAAVVLITSVGTALAKIVCAVKGNDTTPIVNFHMTDSKPNT